MTFELFRLEWRRNRLSAAAMAAAFLLTLPVADLVSSTTGMEPGRAREALLLAWHLLGLPLAACLVGAAAGAAAAAREAVEAEALLPASAPRRAWASQAAALGAFLLLAALVAAVSTALDPGRVLSAGEKDWGDSIWEDLDLAPLLALLILDLLAGAWAFSRLLAHGAAGGLLALLIGLLDLLLASSALVLARVRHDWGSGDSALVFAALLAAAPAKALAGAWVAHWRERSAPRTALARALAPVLLSTLALGLCAAREFSTLTGRLKTLESPAAFRYQNDHDEFPRSARALAAAGESVILQGFSGGVYRAGPDGVFLLVPEAYANSLGDWWRAWSYGAWRDREGTVWLDRYASPEHELWRISGDRAERRGLRDGGLVRPFAGLALKHAYPNGNLRLTAAAELFEKGDRSRGHDGYAGVLRDRAAELAAARPACDGRCLKAGVRTWVLPGRALSGGRVYPDESGGRRVYLVPVRTARGREVALCRDDGRVEIAWPLRLDATNRWGGYGGLPDGTLFSFGPGRKLWAIEPDGRVAPPLSYEALARGEAGAPKGHPFLLRREGGKSWLAWGRKLSVLDQSGRVLSERVIPPADEVRPLRDGFLLVAGRELEWSDWDGRRRQLRKPR
jgi:hypothetical protein